MSKDRLLSCKLWVICTMLIGMLPSCSLGGETILEAKEVQFFKVNEINSATSHDLILSGLAFHSSLAVRNIKTIQEKDSMTIFVYLVPAKAGMSGNFEYLISIPSSVNTINFGNEKIAIWKRGVGEKP
jgi:hypothetical protein